MSRCAVLFLFVTPLLAAPRCGEEDVSSEGGKGGHGKKGGGHEGSVEEHVAQIFSELDADDSGTLTAEEVKDHWLSHKFEKADADGDGQLTADELTEFKKALHSK